jgi:alginate O-acetyltransferase complex protein AlgI
MLPWLAPSIINRCSVQITESSYLIFFVAVLLLHRLLQGRHDYQKVMLTLASYYFYATFDWRFLGLLVALTAINFAAGAFVAQAGTLRQKCAGVWGAVLLSIGILGYFKYLNFFGQMVNSLAHWLGGDSLVPLVDVILPVGISFMTFQAISYPIDLYYGRLKRPFGLLDFSLFIAFFPRLLAGPIVPAAQFLPQLAAPAPRVSADQRFDGICRPDGLFVPVFVDCPGGLQLPGLSGLERILGYGDWRRAHVGL